MTAIVWSIVIHLSLGIGDDLVTGESSHIGHGTGEDGSCSQGADKLWLGTQRGCTELWKDNYMNNKIRYPPY